MPRPQPASLMEAALRRLCTDGRGPALVGGCADRVMEAYASFASEDPRAPGGRAPSLFLEIPLAGEPRCDVGVGPFNSPFAAPAGFGGGDRHCAALAGLAERLPFPHSIIFEVDLAAERHTAATGVAPARAAQAADAGSPADRIPVAGAYVRHVGNLDIAREFFELTGTADGFAGFRTASARLPEGWDAILAGGFFGRPEAPLRLEAMIRPELTPALAADGGALRESLARVGLPFADDAVIELARRFLAICPHASAQFDVRADGSLAGLLSLTLFFDQSRRAARDASSGEASPLRRAIECLQEAGVADGRADLLEHAGFARRVRGVGKDGAAFDAVVSCEPSCCKLKWVDGALQAGKWYQLLRVSPSSPRS